MSDFQHRAKNKNILSLRASKRVVKAAFCVIILLPFCRLSAAESWNATGTISHVVEGRTAIVLQHQGIPGFADQAGDLELLVGEGDHATAVVGRLIRGKLLLKNEKAFLEEIWPSDKEDEKTMTLVNHDLTRPKIGSPKGRLNTGDEFPRFALYNQMGRLVTPEAWSGKVMVVNFVFTRGAVPTMSERTVLQSAELQDRLAEAGLLDSVLLMSISLDPEYDTPGICYAYLDARDVDHESYWMLTGSKKTLDFLTEKIGVVAAPSEKTIINHSMLLLIIDREGKIFHRIPGTRWHPDDVLGRLEILLKGWN